MVPQHEAAGVVRRGHVQKFLEKVFELLGISSFRLGRAPDDYHAVLLYRKEGRGEGRGRSTLREREKVRTTYVQIVGSPLRTRDPIGTVCSRLEVPPIPMPLLKVGIYTNAPSKSWYRSLLRTTSYRVITSSAKKRCEQRFSWSLEYRFPYRGLLQKGLPTACTVFIRRRGCTHVMHVRSRLNIRSALLGDASSEPKKYQVPR